jgi:hypothetical protein
MPNMVFIVGTGRSGTNLLRNILNKHPDVYVGTETHFLPTLMRKFETGDLDIDRFLEVILNHWTTGGTERWVTKHLEAGSRDPGSFPEAFRASLSPVTSGSIRDLVDAFFEFCYGSFDVEWVGDKTPFYGRHMEDIHHHWPGAKFIHMVRDGRFAAPSMQRHEGFVRLINAGFPTEVDEYSHDQRAATFSTDPVSKEQCARFWEQIVTDIRQEAEKIPSSSYLEIRYERLLLNPLYEIFRLTRFLGVPAKPSHLLRGCSTVQTMKLWKQLRNYDEPTYNRLTTEVRRSLEDLGYSTQPYSHALISRGLTLPKEFANKLLWQKAFPRVLRLLSQLP